MCRYHKVVNQDVTRRAERLGMPMPKDFDREYAQAVGLLPEFGKSLESLLSRLLTAEPIQFHSIDHRVKSQKSAELKIARPRKGMNDAGPRTLATLTDLLGIRVITYFRDEVDDVAKVIEREFTIDTDNSVDKRPDDADRFGYLSVHYVAELSQSRTALREYERYSGIKFEIQIRSILQHAWAEIEHDLGYKSEAAVPRAVRRQFSRLAGILELVDDVFVSIRQDIGQHQDEAQVSVEEGSLGIEIDQDSLSAFVQSSPQVAQLDRVIADSRGVTVQDHVDKQFLGRQAEQLVASGFPSIQELSNYLDQNEELLARFAQRWLALADGLTRTGRVPVPIGITLYYADVLRRAQDMDEGKAAVRGHWAHSPHLLRQALHEATI